MHDQSIAKPYQCRNYQSILSAASLLPEPGEARTQDAGCDTCIHYLYGYCDISSPDSGMDSFGLTN